MTKREKNQNIKISYCYRKKAVVRSMRFSDLLECRRQYKEQARLEGKGDSMFEADSRLPMQRFKSGKDDRTEVFHEASMLRLPVAEPEDWWKRVPVKREPVYRNIPLKHCGCESIVNELVVVRMHNRATPVTLKMVHGKNYAMRPGKESGQLDGDWEAPVKMKGVQDALVNYAAISRALWPMDDTPEVIWKVLVRGDWGGAQETDASKAAVVTGFFNALMVENAAGAVKRLPPADYRRAREIWATVLENCGVSAHSGAVGSTQGQKGADKKPGKFKPGTTSPAVAKVGSSFVCHKYNEPVGCPRFPQGQGCRGKNNQVFAHNCNFLKADGSFCLGVHPKHQHK